MGIDSCAAVCCIGKETLSSCQMKEPDGTELYTSALGTTTEMIGVKELTCWLQSGNQHQVRMKVLDPLHKALFSVSELLHTCEVPFDLPEYGGSYLEHRSIGSRTRIYPKDGIFVVPVWFKKPTRILMTNWRHRCKSPRPQRVAQLRGRLQRHEFLEWKAWQ